MVRARLGGGGSESLPVLVRDLAGERERIGNEAAEEGQISQVTVRVRVVDRSGRGFGDNGAEQAGTGNPAGLSAISEGNELGSSQRLGNPRRGERGPGSDGTQVGSG